MRRYVITTDSSADRENSYLKDHQIGVVSLNCLKDGEIYNQENPLRVKEF